MASIRERLAHAWNTFVNGDQDQTQGNYGVGYAGTRRPDRTRRFVANERSLLASINTTIAIDVSAVNMFHARLNQNGQFLNVINSGLNNCLTVEANIDQGARMFKQDAVMSMLEWGVIALVPVDTTLNPNLTGGYDINTMRVGRIVEWYPQHVRVEIWNEQTGRRQELTLSKRIVAIVENPFYSVMNEPNSTLQRLNRKLSLLDVADDRVASGKLDMIIQLPYVIKSESRKQQAEQRRKDIEEQLTGSQYGIAYTDGTEKITQLNRAAENTLQDEVEYLTNQLYGQLGLTPEIMNGTASDSVMLNYYNRTVEPILAALADAMKRTFLTSTARTQLQSIVYIRDPFKLVPVAALAEIADKFTRNEILTSNEFRGIIGFQPSDDPKANKLVNSNMPQPQISPPTPTSVDPPAQAPRLQLTAQRIPQEDNSDSSSSN